MALADVLAHLLIQEIKVCGALILNIALGTSLGLILIGPLDFSVPVVILITLVILVLEGKV